MDSLSSMSEAQALAYYENLLKSHYKHLTEVEGKKLVKLPNPCCNAFEITDKPHDVWSLYSYGNTLKIVYLKRTSKPKFESEKRVKTIATERSDGERFSQSLSRSRAKVFELAMCNEFSHFCTFTQSEKIRDRFDLKEFREDFAMLVRNLNRGREPDNKIKYLLIPEKHQNGAWHMHGLLRGISTDLRAFALSEKLPYKIREKLKKGEKIYDWTAYRKRFGYFTATEIKSAEGCAKYITKYICKDFQKDVRAQGEHLFFASQGLKRRETIIKHEYGACPYVVEWDYENEYCCIKEISLSQNLDT